VDKLLALREDAYRQIAELETKVEDLMGQTGLFVFPPPPLAVAGLEAATPRPRKAARAGGADETPPAPTAISPAEALPTGATAEAPTGDENAPLPKPNSTDRPASRSGGASSRSP
jgi:hypothetical protein